MIRSLKKTKMLMLVLFLLGFSFTMSGCLEDLSLNSIMTDDEIGDFVESDIGKIKILKVNPAIMQFIKDNISDSLLNVEQLLPANLSGDIELGNEYLGFCKLNFISGTLDRDVKINISWDLKNGKFEVEFKPEGLNFNNPVTLEMFYKLAQLEGVDEEKIKLFYFNEEKGIWELIGGLADLANKLFTCQITHFSRYALAHSE